MELLLSILVAAWGVLGEMAPYLLLGFFVAGVLSVFVSPEWVERHLGDGRLSQVFKASLFGVPLPLCSCGVIPVAASLRRHGAGKGATVAFLLSTPQTGVDSIAVTYALLGPFLAIYRPLAALVTGFVGGSLVHVLDRDRVPATGAEAPLPAAGASCDDSCCERPPGRSRALQVLYYGFVILPRDIGRALLVGVLLSGIIAALVPANALAGALGGGVVPILAAMVVGVPLYVCATASVPIAVALIHAGLSPGAALAFLIAGPATNAATLTTLWRVLGRRPVAIFLATVAVAALGSGLVVDGAIAAGMVPASAIVSGTGGGSGHVHDLAGGMSWFHHAAAAVVLLLVVMTALWSRRGGSDEGTASAADVELEIAGMRCNGCVQSVTRALNEIPGVTNATVDLASGTARVTGPALDLSALMTAVTSLGFEAHPR